MTNPTPSSPQGRSDGYRVGAFADGVPGTGYSAPRSVIDDGDPREGTAVGTAFRAVNRIRQFEGPRGYSTRAAVGFRYASYLLGVVVCSAISHWCFSSNPTWQMGGVAMFFSATLMFATAALGTIMWSNYRNEIIAQCRHFVFGIAVVPGTGLAIFMRAMQGLLDSASANNDAFAQILSGPALPLVYFCTIAIPAAIFIKVVAGMRTLNRSHLDDEEMVAAYARQDGRQR